jgi:hypothetical protein
VQLVRALPPVDERDRVGGVVGDPERRAVALARQALLRPLAGGLEQLLTDALGRIGQPVELEPPRAERLVGDELREARRVGVGDLVDAVRLLSAPR